LSFRTISTLNYLSNWTIISTKVWAEYCIALQTGRNCITYDANYIWCNFIQCSNIFGRGKPYKKRKKVRIIISWKYSPIKHLQCICH